MFFFLEKENHQAPSTLGRGYVSFQEGKPCLGGIFFSTQPLEASLAMALAMALAEVPLENYVESEPAKSEAATSNLRGFPKRGHIQTFSKSGYWGVHFFSNSIFAQMEL